MIDRIRLVNFKNHADTQIELGKLTALIGPNSSGKTNVLQALRAVTQLLSIDFGTVFSEDQELKSVVRRGQEKFELLLEGAITGMSKTTPWRISVKIDADRSVPSHDSNELVVNVEWKYGDQEDKIEQMKSARAWNVDLPDEMVQLSEGTVYLKIVSTYLSTPTYTKNVPPGVETDGSGLASAVAYLKTYKEERFSDVLKSLQSVVPSVDNIRVRPAPVEIKERQFIKIDDDIVSHDKGRIIMGHELVFDMTGAQEIPASSVSEGTLLALALLTLLWSPDCPNLVLFDDIEQGLHPKAQRELIAQLRKILEQRPELQIVLTSHSPYIVDELEADEVWLLATDEEGVAQARRLSDHPDAERALEVLTTGEFWSAEGEDWVVADEK